MKPHIKVIHRNGVDVFVTSSMAMKETALEKESHYFLSRHIDLEEKIKGSKRILFNVGVNPLWSFNI